VAVVAFSVLVVGRPRAVVGIRVRGGPTAGHLPLAFRVEAVERLRDTERPASGSPVVVAAGTPPLEWRGTLDGEGAGAVELPPAARARDGRVHARIEVRGVAVDAEWTLSAEQWASRAHRRGGWVERRFDDAVVRAAVERGVLAVPFAGTLWVEAERGGSFVTAVEAHGDGADVAGPIAPARHGRLRFRITPHEHAAQVSLRIAGAPADGFDVALGVIPGALLAELEGDSIVVRAPIVRDRAYVAVVTARERVAGGTVTLSPDGRGGARGVLAGLVLPAGEPLWAVVSSEPELSSPSLVGWPIRYAEDGEPPKTFDVPDALVFDGVGEAVARELARVRRVRLVAALVAVFALAVTASLIALRAKESRAELTRHLEDQGADADVRAAVAGTGGASAWFVVVAVLTLALAALLAALFIVAR
jgi:hypothetical protein